MSTNNILPQAPQAPQQLTLSDYQPGDRVTLLQSMFTQAAFLLPGDVGIIDRIHNGLYVVFPDASDEIVYLDKWMVTK